MKHIRNIDLFIRRFIPHNTGILAGILSFFTGPSGFNMPQNYLKVKNEDPGLFADILEYTRLPEDVVAKLLKREMQSYTMEWKTREVKADYWFYLSSIGYFWGNLPHLNGEFYCELLKKYNIARNGTVLEYGGGVGNISYYMAKEGYKTEYLELSALQKDFLRFRIYKHNIPIRIINVWQSLDKNHYDAILALDIFEHIPNANEILKDQLAPALKKNGILIDFSLFKKSDKDPMHYGEQGEKDLLQAFTETNMELISDTKDCRIWQKAEDRKDV